MNKIDLENQHAVITGGAQGLGFAIAKRLLASGAGVTLWDKDEALLIKAKEELGTKCHTIMVDIAQWSSVCAAYQQTKDMSGFTSILINSAGIAGPTMPLDDYDIEIWQQIINVNLHGTFYVNKMLVPDMKIHNYGRIVNIASIAGKEGNPEASAYAASKAGVIGLTKSLGKELALYDIAVNCITPAAAQTKILEQVAPEFIDFMRSKIPRGRFLEVEEAASMVAWLVSKENSFTTAAVFDLSGGRATY